jgi:hypothetical protein
MKLWTSALVALLLVFSMQLSADDKSGTKGDGNQQPKQDSWEQVVKDTIKMLKDVTKTLSEANDAESAKKAKAELERVYKGQQEINDRVAKLGVRSKEQEDDLTKKYKTELEDVLKSLEAQVTRVMKEPFGKDLLAVIQSKPPIKAAPGSEKAKDK